MLLLFSLLLGFPCVLVTSAIIPASSQCDPVGTVREMSLFERTVHRATNKRCICRYGFAGARCERAYRCVSGRSLAINCTDPPSSLASLTQERCPEGVEREISVCICLQGYFGPLCQHAIPQKKILNLHEGKVYDESYEDFKTKTAFRPREKESNEFSTINFGDRIPTVDADEVMGALERRFWYLAFCLSLASVISILLIGIYFFIMQSIYKNGLKHLTLRELRRRVHGEADSKGSTNSLSLPPPYSEVEEGQSLVPEVSTTIEPVIEEDNEEEDQEPQILYRRTYMHV